MHTLAVLCVYIAIVGRVNGQDGLIPWTQEKVSAASLHFVFFNRNAYKRLCASA